MSQPPEEEQDTEERPISALAPRADSQTDVSPDIFTSPAFQCLEELFSAGKLSGATVAELKAKFKLLQEMVKKSQESEMQLLQDAQHYTFELQRQHQKLEEVKCLPETPDTEAGRLRQQLLRVNNDILLSDERQYQLQFQIECLQNEKTALLMESQAQAKPAEQEKKVKALKESCEELRKEVAQRRLEIRSLKEDLEAEDRQVEREQREVDEKKETIKELEAELAQLVSMPIQVGKEIERITRKKADAEKKKAELEETISEMGTLLKEGEAQVKALEEERRAEAREYKARRSELEAAERQHRQLQHEQDMMSVKVAAIMAQRAGLDANISHVTAEKTSLQESLGRRLREKDRELRSLKKVELQLKVACDDLEQTQSLYTKTKVQRDALPKGDAALQQRQELEDEVKALRLNLIQQQSMTEAEAQVAQLSLEQEQELLRESRRQRQNLHYLSGLTQIKADERQQKARELSRVQQKYNHIKKELKGKHLVIQEHKRQKKEIQARLNVFSKMYDIEKKEREKSDLLIEMASRKLLEMQENFSLLENKIKILHNDLFSKEKLLQKSQVKNRQSHIVLKSLRSEISKVASTLAEMRECREEQNLNTRSLTHTVELRERTLLEMQKSYQAAVQSRRERNIQLQEREEEMHNLQEKVNLQDKLLQDRDIEVRAIEEEINELNVLICEEKRQIELLRKQVAKKKALERESSTLQTQLLECRERLQDLEKALQAPTEGTHIRELSGQDPAPLELLQKIERLELHLAEKEKHLLEKELVYEQVTRLLQQIQAKAQNGRQDTLEFAKKVNELQSRIRDTTRKMMAVTSELSMRQASAIVLQQEVKDRELQLDLCQQRLEQGLPPSSDMELEWQRIQREESRRKAELQESARLAEEEEEKCLPGGGYTTAQRRPNAYIPQGDELPLPRPYGALAPFMPSEPGSSMRHIRKPEPKPIEI